MEIVLAGIIIVLLIIVISILIIRKPKDNTSQIQQLTDAQNLKIDEISRMSGEQNMKMDNIRQTSGEQNVKIDGLNTNLANFNQLNIEQLQNMNQQLNNVYESMGKIQSMSADISQLRKVLANVKQRGSFAETQLKNLLDQTIPGMYEQNVKPNPRAEKIVEFAVKIPSINDDKFVYLPIDSKFPLDKYNYLVQASENGTPEEIESCRKALINSIDLEATKIKNKYVIEPYTTPFAIMFLANEGMYLEAVKDPDGLQEKLANRGIMIAGPSTILALLNALSVGFSSIEINEKAGEIRKLLLNIKQQFLKFDDQLSRIENGLLSANKALNETRDRTRKINNTLDKIEVDEQD